MGEWICSAKNQSRLFSDLMKIIWIIINELKVFFSFLQWSIFLGRVFQTLYWLVLGGMGSFSEHPATHSRVTFFPLFPIHLQRSHSVFSNLTMDTTKINSKQLTHTWSSILLPHLPQSLLEVEHLRQSMSWSGQITTLLPTEQEATGRNVLLWSLLQNRHFNSVYHRLSFGSWFPAFWLVRWYFVSTECFRSLISYFPNLL